MSNRYAVMCDYTCSSHTEVEFPDGKTWEDVETYYIKWGTLFVQFKGADQSYKEFSLSYEYDIDSKRPAGYQIRPLNNEGSVNWDVDLTEGEGD